MASQDLMGRAWQSLGDRLAIDDDSRRERSLWVHQPEPISVDRRPRPPSDRMGICHMPRHHFLAVAIGWGALVVVLLGAVLAVRWLG